ncbi:hypothetical protein SAMN05421636_10596 [Pricia antarctica]|uniref:Uncharacterized protein n=1 Tax=Pricia antarctica TaxID=641691 RepID=A0A1G7CZA0_9FLAO|nr:hypothetical protein SAMN05421636_10596 [Pricia antarctica]
MLYNGQKLIKSVTRNTEAKAKSTYAKVSLTK